jgi:hypothetical protein
VLDPVAEEIQHAKKQRERIKDDDVYFTAGKPPVDAPEWTCKESSNVYKTEYEIDLTQYDDTEEYRERDNDIEEYIQYGNAQGYETELVQDFVRDSAEMNTLRPEDLDEVGESSSKAVSLFNFLLFLFLY